MPFAPLGMYEGPPYCDVPSFQMLELRQVRLPSAGSCFILESVIFSPEGDRILLLSCEKPDQPKRFFMVRLEDVYEKVD